MGSLSVLYNLPFREQHERLFIYTSDKQYLSNTQSIYPSFNLFIYLSIFQSIYPSFNLSIHLSIPLSIFQSIYPSINLFIQIYNHIINPSIYLSIYLSYLPIYLPIYLATFSSATIHNDSRSTHFDSLRVLSKSLPISTPSSLLRKPSNLKIFSFNISERTLLKYLEPFKT